MMKYTDNGYVRFSLMNNNKLKLNTCIFQS